MTPYRLIAYGVGALLVLGLLFAGFRAIYDAGDNAGQEKVQLLWDQDKALIQKEADRAVAKATQERDTALQANEVISNDYQARIDAANSNAANFASRLRNALAATTNRGSTDKTADNPEVIAARTAAVAQQLGQVVGLTAGLYADCKANADQLDALISEIRPQL